MKPSPMVEVRINTLIETSTRLVHNQIHQKADIEMDLEPEIPGFKDNSPGKRKEQKAISGRGDRYSRKGGVFFVSLRSGQNWSGSKKEAEGILEQADGGIIYLSRIENLTKMLQGRDGKDSKGAGCLS